MTAPEQTPYPMMIMHDLESTPADMYLTEWPAHITVVPFFTISPEKELDARQAIRNIAESTLPPAVRQGEMKLYGPNNDVLVTEIEDVDGGLHRLHEQLIDRLGRLGCDFSDLTYALDNYSPHTSHKEGITVFPETLTITSLTVVKKFPKTAPANKYIVDKWQLGI